MGPTASGKTQLAIETIQRWPCDIISVDSAMIYRGMDIGTAKPDESILSIAPHRLINIRDPSDPYSAGDFLRDVKKEIEAILSKGRTPLLVGGTMLYFHVLQNGLTNLPIANQRIREELAKILQEQGLNVLYQRLIKLDPKTITIHPHDQQRILRMLEISESTGKKPSEVISARTKLTLPYSFINLALVPQERATLHHNIEHRFKQMLKRGLVEEVELLFKRNDLHKELPALRAAGYRQIWDYLAGNLNYETAKEKAIAATRQLAKRQLTWLRNWKKPLLFIEDQSAYFKWFHSRKHEVLIEKLTHF